MAEYQSALIQSLRGAPVAGPANPGVTLLPNPVMPQLPPLTLRRGAGAMPGGNLMQVQPAPAPAPYVPPPAVAPPAASGGVLPPLQPGIGPIAPIEPEPEVPDYTEDLGTPVSLPDEDVPIPDYTDDLGPPIVPPDEPPSVPDYTDDLWGPEPESQTPAQTFPVQDQPDLQPRDITEDDVPVPDYTQDLWSDDVPVPQVPESMPDPMPDPVAPQPTEDVPVPDYSDDLWAPTPEDVLAPEDVPVPDYTQDLGPPIEAPVGVDAEVDIDVPVPDYTDDLGPPIPEPDPAPDVTDEEMTQLLLSNFLAEYLLAPGSKFWDQFKVFEPDETVER